VFLNHLVQLDRVWVCVWGGGGAKKLAPGNLVFFG
jgi:hypothetical protein